MKVPLETKDHLQLSAVRSIRYLCDPRKRRGSGQEIWEDILDAFAAHSDIDFAYPTQRFDHNDSEGKPVTCPEAICSSPPAAQPWPARVHDTPAVVTD